MNNYNDTDTFFWDHQKQERVRVTYRVCLAMPATFEGYVDVEADSEHLAIPKRRKSHRRRPEHPAG